MCHNMYFRTSVIAACKSLEILKAIESTFQRHSLAIASLSGHMFQKLASNIILLVEKAKVCNNKTFFKTFAAIFRLLPSCN